MSINNIFNSFSSFFNNNSETNNLKQGKDFLNYEESYKKRMIPYLKPLQLSSSPNLSSIVETLETYSPYFVKRLRKLRSRMREAHVH